MIETVLLKEIDGNNYVLLDDYMKIRRKLEEAEKVMGCNCTPYHHPCGACDYRKNYKLPPKSCL
jgi:hypothetical protein